MGCSRRHQQRPTGGPAAVASATPLFLAVGSSLLVEPAAQLCSVAVERGAHPVIINRDPTPYDELADDVIRADIDDVLLEIVNQLIDNRDRQAAAS